MYGTFVGEIGINRETFLFQLSWWEVNSILKGYRRRHKTLCDMVRWQSWFLASTQCKLEDAGIKCSQDILKFPWDEEEDDEEEEGDDTSPITKEEEERLQELIRQENKRRSAEK